ncbi:MAG: 3-oxoadipate enol-lactonase [Desulfatiglandaceae bacterium]
MKVMVNGIHVTYEISGKEGAPVVVLSHSLGSDMAMWNPQTGPLKPYYRVLRYDTRGHGGSDAPKGPYTLDQLGEDARGLLDALSLEAVHWVGLSMGGMIGQYMALSHPDRLRTLALCDTTAAIPPEAQPVWEERLQLVRKAGMQALVQSTLERWFTSPYLSQNPPEVKLTREQFLATPVSGYIGCSEAIRGIHYLERLSEIRIPTLIMVGEEDQGTPVAASRAMHKRIPDSRLVVLPSAAHLSNIEQTDAFNEALMEFLGKH